MIPEHLLPLHVTPAGRSVPVTRSADDDAPNSSPFARLSVMVPAVASPTRAPTAPFASIRISVTLQSVISPPVMLLARAPVAAVLSVVTVMPSIFSPVSMPPSATVPIRPPARFKLKSVWFRPSNVSFSVVTNDAATAPSSRLLQSMSAFRRKTHLVSSFASRVPY